MTRNYLAKPTVARTVPTGLVEWYRMPTGHCCRDTIVVSTPHDARGDAQLVWWSVRTACRSTADKPRAGGCECSHLHSNDSVRHRYARCIDRIEPTKALWCAGHASLGEGRHDVSAGMSCRDIAGYRGAALGHGTGTAQGEKCATPLLMPEGRTQSVSAYASIVKVMSGGRMLNAANIVASCRTAEH